MARERRTCTRAEYQVILTTAREIIQKKRDRETLTSAEIAAFINGYVSGEIADYQVSAWLMAVYLNGLNT